MRWTQGAAGRPFLSTDGVRKRALTFYQQLPDECASARTGLLDGPVGFVSSCHARDIPMPVKVCGGERVPDLWDHDVFFRTVGNWLREDVSTDALGHARLARVLPGAQKIVVTHGGQPPRIFDVTIVAGMEHSVECDVADSQSK